MTFSPVAKILRAALYLVFAGGVFLVATLPAFLDYYMRIFYDAYAVESGYRAFILYFLMLSGSLGIWIVGEIIGMLRTVSSDPFVLRNVKALKRMGIVAIVTSALFLLKCCIYVTILTLAFGILMLICSLFALTLSELFAQAVRFKEENDLTI